MTQQTMNVVLDKNQYDWIRAIAFNKKFSMSAIIRLALTDYIKKVEEEENKKG